MRSVIIAAALACAPIAALAETAAPVSIDPVSIDEVSSIAAADMIDGFGALDYAPGAPNADPFIAMRALVDLPTDEDADNTIIEMWMVGGDASMMVMDHKRERWRRNDAVYKEWRRGVAVYNSGVWSLEAAGVVFMCSYAETEDWMKGPCPEKTAE